MANNVYTLATNSLFYTKAIYSDGTWSVCLLPRNEEDDQLQLTDNRATAQSNADELTAMHPRIVYEVIEITV
jgi:hypothetical protein